MRIIFLSRGNPKVGKSESPKEAANGFYKKAV
jgi:hypothetical protein